MDVFDLELVLYYCLLLVLVFWLWFVTEGLSHASKTSIQNRPSTVTAPSLCGEGVASKGQTCTFKMRERERESVVVLQPRKPT